MEVFLIIIGLVILFAWAADVTKGKENPAYRKITHEPPVGCLPYIIGIGLIGLGIYLLG